MLFIHPDCFCVSLRVLGDISCRNSSVSFQKPWPGYSTSSSDLIDSSFHVGTKLFVLLPLSCLSPADVVKGFMCVHVVINTQTISCVVVFGVIKQSGMKTHSVYRQLCLWQLFRCSQAVWWCFVCYGDDFYILQIPQLHNLGKQSRTMWVSGLDVVLRLCSDQWGLLFWAKVTDTFCQVEQHEMFCLNVQCLDTFS